MALPAFLALPDASVLLGHLEYEDTQVVPEPLVLQELQQTLGQPV